MRPTKNIKLTQNTEPKTLNTLNVDRGPISVIFSGGLKLSCVHIRGN